MKYKRGVNLKEEIFNISQMVSNEGEKRVYILGHDNPDVDSIISGIMLGNFASKLHRPYGVEWMFVLPNGKVDKETADILKGIGLDTRYIMRMSEENIQGRPVFLVDHYETVHSNKVIGCIDHHPTSKKINYGYYQCEARSAAAKIIHDLIIESGEEINPQEVYWTMCAMMVDTNCFVMSGKARAGEEEWVKVQCRKRRIEYEGLFKKCIGLTDLNQSVQDIAEHGIKKYKFGSKRVISSYIQVTEENTMIEEECIVHNINTEY